MIPLLRSWLGMLVLLLGTCGATCMPRPKIADFQPTPLFNGNATIEQLAEVLNRSHNIQTLHSPSVNIKPNKPIDIRNLESTLTWQREKRFRILGSASRLLGNNLDMGSNDELFWMAIRDFSSPQLFYARHADFDAQVDRRILAVSPLWLIEALGVSGLDLAKVTKQPTVRPDQLVEIESAVPTPTGTYTRTLIVDPKFGYTRQIYLRDPNGRLVANAMQSQHQLYPSVNMCLPHRVLVQMIPINDPPIELDITIGNYLVNSLDPSNATGFEMPNPNGFQVIDLAQFNRGLPQAVSMPQVAPPANNRPSVSYRGVPMDDSFFR